MESIALFIGYAFISIIGLMLLYAFFQWLLYGQVGDSMSSKIIGNKVYVNDKLVAETNANSISVINGSVYANGICIYKHKKKFRWEK